MFSRREEYEKLPSSRLEDQNRSHGRLGLYLHGVVGVLVVEDQGFLDELVVSFQLVDLWLVVDDALLVLAEVRQLVLQGSVHLDGDAANFLPREDKRPQLLDAFHVIV